MKKLQGLVVSILLAWHSIGIAAPICENFNGTLVLNGPLDCSKFMAIPEINTVFMSADFLFSAGSFNTCFSGTITNATLGRQPVTGESLSALTVNQFGTMLSGSNFSPITAATVVTLTTADDKKDKKLGTIFLRDVGIVDPNGFAVEQLFGVAGNKQFSTSGTTFKIVGHEFVSASITGKVCTF